MSNEAPNSIPATKETHVPESNFHHEGLVAFVPLPALVRDVPAEPEWLWDGYLAPGTITLAAGRPKVGKSTLIFGLLSAVSTGAPFLGRDTGESGVLLLSEEGVTTLAEKVTRWNITEAVHAATHGRAGGVPWPEVVASAVAHCHAHGLGLLVVDTLAQWARLAGDSENDAGSALEQVRPLQAAAASGLCVLIVAHQRKSSGEFGEAVRGSNALTGAVDVILELERPSGFSDPSHRVLRAVSRYEKTPAELHLSLTEDGYTVVGDSAAAKAQHQRATLLEALAAMGSGTAEDLADASEIAVRKARRVLEGLYDDGTIGRTGRGVKGSPLVYQFDSGTRDSLLPESNLLEAAGVLS